MALCVRAFAHVSVAHKLRNVSLLSSSLWGGQARPCVRFQLKTGHWVPAKNWNGLSHCRYMRVKASAAGSRDNKSPTIFYADAGIYRAAEMRSDADKLSHAFNSPESLVVPLLQTRSLVKDGKPVLIAISDVPVTRADYAQGGNLVFLGLTCSTQAPVFAVNVAELYRVTCAYGDKVSTTKKTMILPFPLFLRFSMFPSVAGQRSFKIVSMTTDGERPEWEKGAQWVDVRQYGPLLQASDAGLLAYARGMVEWQSRNKFCGQCGSRTVAKDGGHALSCSSESCGNSAYPRLDPAVIMLVTCGNYVLLGRQSKWNPGRYSLLAGFVEIGETFEMAVAREVREESGVNVDLASVSYAASQPWPFPSSLMVGLNAEAIKNKFEPYHILSGHGNAKAFGAENLVDEVNSLPRTAADKNELEDARWIHKDFLRWILLEKPLSHGVAFSIPGQYAIAYVLLNRWAASKNDMPWAGEDVKSVEIDEGVFKYVLMSLKDDHGHGKLVVRGNRKLNFHSDILEATQKEVEDLGLQVLQLGGGQIEHNIEQRKLHVFSVSQAYGPADHTVTCALLKQWFPLHSITFALGD